MILLEERTKTSPIATVVVNVAFNVFALYLSHLISLEVWRTLTGH
jgi:hypothetical protein